MDDKNLKNFLDFIGSPKSRVYYYLFNEIVRGPNYDPGHDDFDDDDYTKAYTTYQLNKAFYERGWLVASETQKNIGKFLGSTQATVGNHIRSLVNEGAIRTHRFLITDEHYYRFYVNVYILGFIKDGKEYFLLNNKYKYNIDEIITDNVLVVDNTPAFFGGVKEININE